MRIGESGASTSEEPVLVGREVVRAVAPLGEAGVGALRPSPLRPIARTSGSPRGGTPRPRSPSPSARRRRAASRTSRRPVPPRRARCRGTRRRCPEEPGSARGRTRRRAHRRRTAARWCASTARARARGRRLAVGSSPPRPTTSRASDPARWGCCTRRSKDSARPGNPSSSHRLTTCGHSRVVPITAHTP